MAAEHHLVVDERAIATVHVLDEKIVADAEKLCVVTTDGTGVNHDIAFGMSAQNVPVFRQRMPLPGGISILSRQTGHRQHSLGFASFNQLGHFPRGREKPTQTPLGGEAETAYETSSKPAGGTRLGKA